MENRNLDMENEAEEWWKWGRFFFLAAILVLH
jgi:hypothetical protein